MVDVVWYRWDEAGQTFVDLENANAESAHTCQVYRELVTRLHAGPDGSNLDCCFYEPPNPDDDKLTAINEPMYQQDPGVFASGCSEQEGCIARVPCARRLMAYRLLGWRLATCSEPCTPESRFNLCRAAHGDVNASGYCWSGGSCRYSLVCSNLEVAGIKLSAYILSHFDEESPMSHNLMFV